MPGANLGPVSFGFAVRFFRCGTFIPPFHRLMVGGSAGGRAYCGRATRILSVRAAGFIPFSASRNGGAGESGTTERIRRRPDGGSAAGSESGGDVGAGWRFLWFIASLLFFLV